MRLKKYKKELEDEEYEFKKMKDDVKEDDIFLSQAFEHLRVDEVEQEEEEYYFNGSESVEDERDQIENRKRVLNNLEGEYDQKKQKYKKWEKNIEIKRKELEEMKQNIKNKEELLRKIRVLLTPVKKKTKKRKKNKTDKNKKTDEKSLLKTLSLYKNKIRGNIGENIAGVLFEGMEQQEYLLNMDSIIEMQLRIPDLYEEKEKKRIFHEVKTGPYAGGYNKELEKDMQLLKMGQVDEVYWHFFRVRTRDDIYDIDEFDKMKKKIEQLEVKYSIKYPIKIFFYNFPIVLENDFEFEKVSDIIEVKNKYMCINLIDSKIENSLQIQKSV